MYLSTFHEIFIRTYQSQEGEFSYRREGPRVKTLIRFTMEKYLR